MSVNDVKWIDLECDSCGKICAFIQRIGTLFVGGVYCDDCVPDDIRELA